MLRGGSYGRRRNCPNLTRVGFALQTPLRTRSPVTVFAATCKGRVSSASADVTVEFGRRLADGYLQCSIGANVDESCHHSRSSGLKTPAQASTGADHAGVDAEALCGRQPAVDSRPALGKSLRAARVRRSLPQPVLAIRLRTRRRDLRLLMAPAARNTAWPPHRPQRTRRTPFHARRRNRWRSLGERKGATMSPSAGRHRRPPLRTVALVALAAHAWCACRRANRGPRPAGTQAGLAIARTSSRVTSILWASRPCRGTECLGPRLE